MMTKVSLVKMSQNNIMILLVMVFVLLACARPSGGSTVPCKSCEIDDDMLLEKRLVCSKCGDMFRNGIEQCCYCDHMLYDKCLLTTGLQNKDTGVHGQRRPVLKRLK